MELVGLRNRFFEFLAKKWPEKFPEKNLQREKISKIDIFVLKHVLNHSTSIPRPQSKIAIANVENLGF